jgi:hypothetical protein
MQFAFSFTTQAFLAALALAQNLVLIRFAESTEYAHFVLVSAIALTAGTIMNASVLSPMAVMLPSLQTTGSRRRYEIMFSTISMLGVGLAALLTAIVVIASGHASGTDIAASCGFVAAALYREFLRSFHFVSFRAASALRGDTIIAGATVVFSALLWLILRPDQAILLGAALGTLILIAADPCIGRPRSFIEIRLMVRLYRRIAHDTNWSLAGAAAAEFQHRAYVYVTQLVLGAPAISVIQAGRLPFGPLNILFSGFGRAARPKYSSLIGRGQVAEARKLLMWHLLGILVANATLGGALYLVWGVVDQLIFAARYPGVWPYVLLWGVMMLIFQLRSTLGIFLQAQRRFRQLAMVSFAGSLACCGLLAAFAVLKIPLLAVGSVVVSELTMGVLLLALLWLRQMTVALPPVLSARRIEMG